ncbi:hypothetical protein [Rhodoferax sp.]|uniref:hypothetical protein n=1 Tax=Rhodoferax sp. TaxID=50421 RepID=UPI0025F40AB1|nr:hypothetical protein [Rhodoferax sp.]
MPKCLRWLCAASLLVLAACASPLPQVVPDAPRQAAPIHTPPAPPPLVLPPPILPAPDPTAEAGRELQHWQDQLRQAAPDVLPALAARIAAEPATPASAVHLALVWLHTRVPGDAAKALAQLEALQTSADPAAQPWADWVRLLASRATEQKRLDEQINRQAQQLRDSQRRIDQLTEQLEALKAIERSLAPRNGVGKAP